MVMANASMSTALFVPTERWGWEFVDPGDPRRSALADRQPVLPEPPPRPAPAPKTGMSMTKRVVILAVLCLVFLPAAASAPAALLVPLIAAAVLLLPRVLASSKASSALQEWESGRQRAQRAYEQQLREWRANLAAHGQAESQRLAEVDLWYPLALQTSTDRVDVVGGVPGGWRHMLTTFGVTVLARQTTMLVLDLSEEGVADGLMEISSGRCPVQGFRLPEDGDKLDLLSGLDADEIAEILADAADALRSTPNAALRATDADILRAVAQRLNESIRPARLAAGISVLQRTYDDDDGGGGVLTQDEISKLTNYIDRVGSGERVQEQLQFLRVAMNLLQTAKADGRSQAVSSPIGQLMRGKSPRSAGRLDNLWRDGGLTVIATESPNASKKDFTDRVLFHSLLQRLRDRNSSISPNQVLVVVGADHIGAQALEAMARQCRAREVRLVYFFEHLRDSSQRLLGGGQSAAMIMRLGNGAEAAAAAEFIGRGYSFKLSQITRQLGSTDSVGGGENWGNSTTTGWSRQTNSGPDGASSGRSYSESVSESYQKMSNWSRAESVMDGATQQRVYEFAIEPQTVQTLPVTAFILVEGGAQGRRASIADCNPAIAMLDRVAKPAVLAH